MVSVVAPEVLPAGKDEGLKVALAAAGKPDAEKFTAFASTPPCVPKFIAKIAGCPAAMVTAEPGPVTEKLSITKLTEFEPPPPGVGLATVTPTEPVAASSVDAIFAVRVVPLFKTVPACDVPLKISVAPVANPVPVAVSGVIGVPTGAIVGEIEVSTGTGLLIVKLTELDAPPPGVGLVTIMGTTPAVANSLAAMVAVIVDPPLETVPGWLTPLKLTVAPVAKFVPVMAKAGIACPTRALVGLTEVTVGTGLLIVKLTELDVPPPGAGLVTTTGTAPAEVNSEAGIEAVIVVPPLETTPALAVPLKLTVAPVTKLVPLTVSAAIVWPKTLLVGLIEVMTGSGLVPVPVSGKFGLEPEALSANVRFPEAAPATIG